MATNEKIVLYVDPTAASRGDGSQKTPFRSLETALAASRDLLCDATAVDVTLSLAGGTHLCYNTLSLDGDAQNPDSTLLIEGVAGKTVITAARPFDASLFEKVEGNLYAAHVAGMRAFRHLYVDGKIATLAHAGGRFTDDEDIRFIRFDRTHDAKDETRDARPSCKLYLGMDLVKPLVGDRTSGRVNVSCEYHGEYEWGYNIMHINAVDLDDTALYEENGEKELCVACYFPKPEYRNFSVPAGHEAGLGQAGGYHLKTRSYFLSNAKAFCNREGFYYYDVTREVVYYYTEGDISTHTFACGKLDQLFACRRVRNLTFRGVTFTGTDNMRLSLGFHAGGQASSSMGDFPTQAAFYSWDACGLTFEDCRFEQLAAEGIRLRGRVDRFTVKDCTFREIGSSAIRAASPKMCKLDEEDGNADVRIENNLLEGIAREYPDSPAIMLTSSRRMVITRNTIRDCAYTGISIGWSWSYKSWAHDVGINLDEIEISRNYITDYMRNLCDGGAIYTLGGNAPKTDHNLYNRCFENVVVMNKRTGSGRGVCLMGIYYDGSSSNWLSRNNVVVAQSLGADPDEENPGYTERFLHTFRERRRRSLYYFCQDAGVYGANNWSYNISNEDCYLIRPRKTDLIPLNIETHYCTMGEVEDIVPEEEKDAVLREKMPEGLSFEERLHEKRKRAAARDVINRNMTYVYTWDALPDEAATLITAAGAAGAHADLDELKADRY